MSDSLPKPPIGPEFDIDDKTHATARVRAVATARNIVPPVAEVQVASPRRASTVPVALIPAVVLMTVAATLLIGRLIVPDWQGLFTEATRPSITLAQNEANPTPEPLAQNEANPTPEPLAQNEANPTPEPLAQNEANPAPEPLAQNEANPAPEPLAQNEANPAPEPLAQNEANPAPEPLAQNEANLAPDTAAAVDDIQREAQRKKKELAELEKLRKEAEARAAARAPRQPDPFAPLNRQDRELWVRRQREIERQMLENMIRAQQEFQKRFDDMTRQAIPRPRPWPPAPPHPPAPRRRSPQAPQARHPPLR